MNYSVFIWSTASFIETRIKEPIEYTAMEQSVGFSYRHIRETFKESTGVSLSRYILQRRIANSAFDIMHTHKSLTEIASDYLFDSYDTFTRAFKRYTNHLPSELRNRSCHLKVGRQRIVVGMYAPTIMNNEENVYAKPQLTEVEYNMNYMEKSKESCILYGVPKVAYSFEECTPFCTAMKACLNYMGQQVDYSYIMAVTGAAFRLRWNTGFWDGGNVDIMNIYEDRFEAFKRAFRAAGRSYRILKREESDKEGFIQFMRAEIDEGRPLIAFGIIGPPEACLITGYRNNGETLLGWNCFQENREYAKDVTLDESGYFVTGSWWENECTVALIAVGEKQEALSSHKENLTNALEILTKERVVFNGNNKEVIEYAGGQRAYECWANSIADDREFPKNAVLPHIFERIVCQNDAQDMVCEGRSNAVLFMEAVAKENEIIAEPCRKAAELFRKTAECGFKMNDFKGGMKQDEEAVRKFAEPAIRQELVKLIRKAKDYEAKACEQIKEAIALI